MWGESWKCWVLYIFIHFSHLHFSKRVNGIFSSLFTSRLSKTHSRRTLFVTRIYWLGQVLRLAFLLALAETSLNCSFVCEISILDNGTTFMFGQIIHLFGTEILYYCTIKWAIWEPSKDIVSIGNHEKGIKNAVISPLTMKWNVFCASKNHIPRGKNVKIVTFAYGQAGSLLWT